jgi:uncharacterized protein (DUF2235 family)
LCCDGTWNKPDTISEGVRVPTNVAKVALGLPRVAKDGVSQLLHYERGVGTRRFERVRGGAFGYGLSHNVRDCYRFLVETYEPGDTLYFFGFSRGAYTARSVVGLIRNCGILRRKHVDRIDEAYALYRSRASRAHPSTIESQLSRRMYAHEDVSIHFIGVWDTVGALGIPIDGLRVPFIGKYWGFHDTELSGHVASAYQALAIDEQRGPFKPTLWTRKDPDESQILEQVWFAGVHCDVGGGYADPALADITLLWMVNRARERGLQFDDDAFTVTAAPTPEARYMGKELAPDALGAIKESRKGFYRVLGRNQREITDRDSQSVASSAARRLRERSEYRPPSLVAWVDADQPRTQVQDTVPPEKAA